MSQQMLPHNKWSWVRGQTSKERLESNYNFWYQRIILLISNLGYRYRGRVYSYIPAQYSARLKCACEQVERKLARWLAVSSWAYSTLPRPGSMIVISTQHRTVMHTAFFSLFWLWCEVLVKGLTAFGHKPESKLTQSTNPWLFQGWLNASDSSQYALAFFMRNTEGIEPWTVRGQTPNFNSWLEHWWAELRGHWVSGLRWLLMVTFSFCSCLSWMWVNGCVQSGWVEFVLRP